MRVLLVNPPYQTFTSNVGVGHQVPLGLLMVGGALADAGHEVRLLDAEALHLRDPRIVREAGAWGAEAVLTGHAGSTPAHPVCLRMLRAIKEELPHVATVYGGVYPSYHAAEILAAEPAVDAIVQGEGEAASVELLAAVEAGRLRWSGGASPLLRLAPLPGVTFRRGAEVVTGPPRPPITDLDTYRTGWELIDDWERYRCFGLGRAAIVQFSRGCPYSCTYCGQHGFWVRWRHRDPERLAQEVEDLYRRHDVRFVTLADENPTTLEEPWRRFLAAMASRRLPVRFFSTIRATDIVRDADLLSLYREAGILYVLMGVDSTDEAVLEEVRKRSSRRHDFLACRLLRQNGIYSILGHVVGFRDETLRTLLTAGSQLHFYGADYLNAMYATPHSWTPFGRAMVARGIVEHDLAKWDYRHQVIAQATLSRRQLFLGVKLMEVAFHLHPSRLWRLLAAADPSRRRQARWSIAHTAAVWLAEVAEFVARELGAAWERLRRRGRPAQGQVAKAPTSWTGAKGLPAGLE
jgi:anaerobic magnesium-protoporphyrin IX monomethyl ester cyclase